VEANRGDFSSDYRPSRLRNFLVASQVAVCVLLLICSAVALRAQRRVSNQDIRIRTAGVFNLLLSKPLPLTGVERLRASGGDRGRGGGVARTGRERTGETGGDSV
jgi:hypothetical protein